MIRKSTIFTIGHSTHESDGFIEMLKAYNIELLVDIRHYPGSRHCPQFGKKRLEQNLQKHFILYQHIEELGGRRRPLKNSEQNKGWRSPQFRGYADYMQTPEFRAALRELMTLARIYHTVIMCSEAVPWRCHRSLVGDALLVHNFNVCDIFSKSNIREHKLTPFAEVHGRRVIYPSS